MELAMIGLGKMGANMAKRLLEGGHRVVGFDPREEAVKAHEAIGGVGARTLEEAVHALQQPRAVWVMVPSGVITDDTIQALSEMLSEGDTLIDGGNTFYKDSLRHESELAGRHIHFVDVGTSGGIWGLAEGYSMMVGGEQAAVNRLRPVLETLAPTPNQQYKTKFSPH